MDALEGFDLREEGDGRWGTVRGVACCIIPSFGDLRQIHNRARFLQNSVLG